MSVRFAGDFFGISLVDPGEDDQGSALMKYYPELRNLPKKADKTNEFGIKEKEKSARLYGGAEAAPVFSGFKTFGQSATFKPAPLFTGFKTFEQSKD